MVKTPTWDVGAWNAAAVAVFGDYASAPARERNMLRRMFSNPALRPGSPERQQAEAAGWHIPADGMEITL